MKAGAERDRFLVEEMLRHLALVQEVAKAGQRKLESDALTRYGLEHAIELLAEAAKHASGPLKSANPDVPWTVLRSIGRAVAHPYDVGSEDVKIGRLWRFAVEDAPKLARQLKRARFGV